MRSHLLLGFALSFITLASYAEESTTATTKRPSLWWLQGRIQANGTKGPESATTRQTVQTFIRQIQDPQVRAQLQQQWVRSGGAYTGNAGVSTQQGQVRLQQLISNIKDPQIRQQLQTRLQEVAGNGAVPPTEAELAARREKACQALVRFALICDNGEFAKIVDLTTCKQACGSSSANSGKTTTADGAVLTRQPASVSVGDQ